jgi:hypothetical protein
MTCFAADVEPTAVRAAGNAFTSFGMRMPVELPPASSLVCELGLLLLDEELLDDNDELLDDDDELRDDDDEPKDDDPPPPAAPPPPLGWK